MTIQPPPDDEMPPSMPIDDPADTPVDPPQEPEQRAPGEEQLPLGAPRDEPDPQMS